MMHILLAQARKSDNWMAENWVWIAGAIGLIVFLIFLLIFFSFVKLWIQSLLAGAKIGILGMIRMKLLNNDYSIILRRKIAPVQAGVQVARTEPEQHLAAAGQPQKGVGSGVPARTR